jgi:molybdopterin synthase sulfur carrier subunit
MATVFIPALLRKLTGGKDRVQAQGNSVWEVVDNLERQFPGIRERIVQGNDLAPSLAVSVDGEVVPTRLLEPVQEASEIHFLPAIGGG